MIWLKIVGNSVIICSPFIHVQTISNVYIVDDIVCSDHFPLCIDINCNITPICDSNFVKHSKNVCNWKIAGDLGKSRYYSSTDKLLSALTQ